MRIIIVAVFLIGLAAPAWPGFDKGLAAYKRGDYATAVRAWRVMAERGNAWAQNNLGVMYENGRGVSLPSGRDTKTDEGSSDFSPKPFHSADRRWAGRRRYPNYNPVLRCTSQPM